MFRTAVPEDLEVLRSIYTRSFNGPGESVGAWMDRAGWDNVRVVEHEGVPAAATVRIPMGMFFGGCSVSNLGIAGVATAPEARRRGLAQHAVGQTLVEARAEGFAISTLFPASWRLYRKLGYELAGEIFQIELDVQRLPAAGPRADFRCFSEADRASVKAIYTQAARHQNGLLDRGGYIWQRVEAPMTKPADGFVASFDGVDEGYIFYKRVEGKTAPLHNLAISDWKATTARAAQALIAFVASHGSMVQRVRYSGNAQDVWTAQLEEAAYTCCSELSWMLRVLDPVRALSERGYPGATRVSVALEVTEDPLFPENIRAWRLNLADGKAEISPATKGELRGGIRAFSALFCGYRSARELARWGWLEGDDDALARADIAFAGPTPCLDHLF